MCSAITTPNASATAAPVLKVSAAPPAGWDDFCRTFGYAGYHVRSEWASVFRSALGHTTRFLYTEADGRITGVLPAVLVEGPVFGRFVVSQPYLNTGGVLTDDPRSAELLIGAAVRLAEERRAKRLELRHETKWSHEALNSESREKVHMRLKLPTTADELWESLKSKVRSQIRKPLNDERLGVRFGGYEELPAYYEIFCRNMRDLGTPPFSERLFRGMLDEFANDAEICTITYEDKPVASGFLLHGPGTTLIPSASSLREYNRTSCNMLMYWHAISRAIERGQQEFDFGRSTPNSGTWKFKKQWGAVEQPAIWQCFSADGNIDSGRPGSGKYDRMIELWKKLPVWLTKLIGPTIVRGVP